MSIKFKFRSFEYVKEIIESYEDENVMNDFLETFEEDKDISYEDYFKFCEKYFDDMSEVNYVNQNWNDEYDE